MNSTEITFDPVLPTFLPSRPVHSDDASGMKIDVRYIYHYMEILPLSL